MLANALNDAGYDMKLLLAHREIPWSQNSVKEQMWRPVQQSMFDIDSTTQLAPSQVSQVYDTINRFLSEKFAISVEFPSKENRK